MTSRTTTSVQIALNTEPFVTAMKDFARAALHAVKVFERFGVALNGGANRAAYVSGREAAMYVRGGLDSAYASEESLGTLVRDLLRGQADPVDALMSTENRARLAASALQGWIEHRWIEQETTPPIWHRYLAGTVVLVTTEKE